jgi:hypothetical protein
MRPLLIVVAISMVVGACSPGGSDFDVERVVASLEARGATVELQPSPHEPIEGVTGSSRVLCVNGYEAIILEYAGEDDRRAEVDEDPPEHARNRDICWGKIGWWAKGNVVVYFHYDPTNPGSVVPMLNAVLGPSIGRTGHAFGTPPDEIPLSDRCT